MFIKPCAFYFKKLKFTPDIILASQSPRRQELIQKITNNVKCVPADVDEQVGTYSDVLDIPLMLAKQKAEYIASQYKNNIVIGCDTVVILNDKVLGKPKDRDDALKMLKDLSGNKHIVVTGCCIIKGDSINTFNVVSEVWFKKLSDKKIIEYVESGDCYDKAGGYGIQTNGKSLVKKYSGDYFNIVGFPIKAIRRELFKINK